MSGMFFFFLQFMDILHLYICIGKFGKGATLFGSEGVLVNKWRLKQYIYIENIVHEYGRKI